jgi:hypothetical protein
MFVECVNNLNQLVHRKNRPHMKKKKWSKKLTWNETLESAYEYRQRFERRRL